MAPGLACLAARLAVEAEALEACDLPFAFDARRVIGRQTGEEAGDAIAELEGGKMARQAFGDDVIDHYLNYARTEQRLFDQVVTCYERERMFERG